MSELLVLQMFGLIYLSLGIGMFINTKFYSPILKEYKSNPAMTMLTGVISFVIGFLIVSNHNVWSPEISSVMITLLGWLSMVSGLLILAFPTMMVKMVGKFSPLANHTKVWSIIIFVLGAIISYMGFM